MDPIKLLSFLTLLANVFVGLYFIFWIFSKNLGKLKIWQRVDKLLIKNALLYAFIIGLTATLGSLYLSEIRNLTPCKLCWLQRVFMYPMPFLLGVAYFKKARDVAKYVLPLSIVGGLIAVYHYYLQINPQPLAPCTTVGFSVSCSERFFTHFGYITIPWMSFSAFLIITMLSKIYLLKK
jgi:disulfide bond formation protein DsbB